MVTRLVFSVIAGSLICGASAQAGGARERDGVYSDVEISPMSGDCYGVSFKLRFGPEAKGKRAVSGSYFEECNNSGPGVAIEGEFVSATGRLEVRAANADSQTPVARLKGVLTKGLLNGDFAFGEQSFQRLRLKRLTKSQWRRIGGDDV